jgi:hypothetical protein
MSHLALRRPHLLVRAAHCDIDLLIWRPTAVAYASRTAMLDVSVLAQIAHVFLDRPWGL